jgi:hypothetical protein
LGAVPPFTGLAVKVAGVVEQTLVVEALILTEGIKVALTVVLEVAAKRPLHPEALV